MPMMQQMLLGMGGNPPPAVSYIGISKGNAPNPNTTISFTGVPIGAADPTRRVVFAVHTQTGGSNTREVTAFTVDGVSVFPRIFEQVGGINSGRIALFSVLKPTGTTADLAFTFNSASGGTNISVSTFRAINETSSTPHNSQGATSSAAVVNMVLNIPANGWAIAAAAMFGSTSTPTDINFTGVTETSSDVLGTSAIRVGTGVQNDLGVETGRPISGTATPTPTLGQTAAIAGLSWG